MASFSLKARAAVCLLYLDVQARAAQQLVEAQLNLVCGF